MATVRPDSARTKAELRAFCARARQKRARNCSAAPIRFTPEAPFTAEEPVTPEAPVTFTPEEEEEEEEARGAARALVPGGIGCEAGPKAARRATMPSSSESVWKQGRVGIGIITTTITVATVGVTTTITVATVGGHWVQGRGLPPGIGGAG